MTSHANIISKGSSVTLCYMRPEYITDQYVGWLNDPDVVKYSNQRFQLHTLKSCMSYLNSFVDTTNYFLAIMENHSGVICGSITAYLNIYHNTADLGLMVGDRSLWGRGYGLEAWELLMRHLGTLKKVRKITGGTLSCNIGMITIMERAGMKLEAVKKQQELVGEVPMDMHYYAKFYGD